MLDAALAMVEESGLTVSLEHLSFEDVIRDAGVSRSAVYRRWPHKEEFFSDLLREVAKSERPSAVPDRETAMAAIRAWVCERAEWLHTPEDRHALVVEMLRLGALGDFEAIPSSAGWRTYVGLQATYLSLEDGELRDDVEQFLAESDRAMAERIAGTLAYFAGLMGYRVRPGLNADFHTIASVGIPTMRGTVIMGPSLPALTERTVHASPFGDGRDAEWSPLVVAMTGVVLTYLEPDPDVVWDDDRIAAVLAGVAQ